MRRAAVYALALCVAALAIAPLVVLALLAEDFSSVFDSRNLILLSNTLLLAALTAAGSVLIGVPLAVITAFVALPGRRVWLAMLASPLAIPSYLGAFTLYAAFGPGGEIEGLSGMTTPAFQGLAGSAIIMALYTFPFVLLTTRAALLSQDRSLILAARTLGMSLYEALLRVALPRAGRGIAAGALLAALYAISDFGTPSIMNLDTFTRLIYVEYNAYGLSQAALFSLQLMALVGLVLFLESQVGAVRKRPGEALIIFPSRAAVLGLFASVLPILVLAIVLPLGIFALWLAREGTASFDFAIGWNSAYASLLAAGGAAALAIPVALVAQKGFLGKTIERLCYFGFGIPGIVMGTALGYLGLRLPMLYQTLALLVLAYLMRFLPLAIGAIRSALDKLDNSTMNAARILGANPGEVFRRVTLPLTARGIIAGAALVFLEAMRELPATLLLAPTGFETLATYLWRVYEAGYFGRAAIPGLLLVLLSIAGLVMALAGEADRDRVSTPGPQGATA